jgi:hypothetical protein
MLTVFSFLFPPHNFLFPFFSLSFHDVHVGKRHPDLQRHECVVLAEASGRWSVWCGEGYVFLFSVATTRSLTTSSCAVLIVSLPPSQHFHPSYLLRHFLYPLVQPSPLSPPFQLLRCPYQTVLPRLSFSKRPSTSSAKSLSLCVLYLNLFSFPMAKLTFLSLSFFLPSLFSRSAGRRTLENQLHGSPPTNRSRLCAIPLLHPAFPSPPSRPFSRRTPRQSCRQLPLDIRELSLLYSFLPSLSKRLVKCLIACWQKSKREERSFDLLFHSTRALSGRRRIGTVSKLHCARRTIN